MTREQRQRYAGTVFYLVLAASLFLTESGVGLVQSLQADVDLYQAMVALVALGGVFFTSEPIGILFNAVHVFLLWNVKGWRRPEFGGYAAEWRKLSYDLKRETVERSEALGAVQDKRQRSSAAEQGWKQYGPDVFLSYFWQQAPQPLIQWVSRRHTVFFVNRANILAIGIALLLSTVLIQGLGLVWTLGTCCVFVASCILVVFFEYNARSARTEAWQMIDLWMHAAFDSRVGKAIEDIRVLLSAEPGHTETFKPSHTVMRANDVKAREIEDDRRLYYFGSDVDIVSTTISKRHIEPSHLHTMNTESYYVVHGELLVNVEGQDIWLGQGDLVVVNPGSCHHFETTAEEVTILAKKRKPGLDDKKLC